MRALVAMAGLCVSLGSLGGAAAPRMVDSSAETGFAIYRSGQLSSRELKQLCSLGVEELLVLDGGATDRECQMRQLCPDLRVRYSFAQDPDHPVSLEFLAAFDQWIEEGRAEGRKLAFRCRRGWHRAGRLTAYYEMRYQLSVSWSLESPAAEESMSAHSLSILCVRVSRQTGDSPWISVRIGRIRRWRDERQSRRQA
jgi:hypothetical protein